MSRVSVKTNKVTFTPSQFKALKTLLKLEGSMSESQRLNKIRDRKYDEVSDLLLNHVDVIKFQDQKSTYHHLMYKSYKLDLDPYYKKFRGIIVKDYKQIVCGSSGSTPSILIDKPLEEYIETNKKGKRIMSLTETLENGKKEYHRVPFDEKTVSIRPSFQGTIIRVWLSNGNLFRSSLRKPIINNATWIQTETDGVDVGMTFTEKFDSLCGFGRDQFFKPGVKNSPFCYIFLMCSPQATTYSRIDCGRGYLLYLETKECYTPIIGDPDEEEKSFFLSRIPKEEMSEEEALNKIKRQIDRYVIPLPQPDNESPLAKFIPKSSTEDYLAFNSAVYKTVASMTLDEANDFLIRGVDRSMKRRHLRKMKEEFPLQLPGEALYCTFIVKGKTQNFILNPPSVNYKVAMIKDVNNRQNQLMQLRDFARENPSRPLNMGFFGIEADLANSRFEDLCYSRKDLNDEVYYYGIRNDATFPDPPTDNNYHFLSIPEGVLIYPLEEIVRLKMAKKLPERGTYTTTRWFIIAYYYCLCLPPNKRTAGWNSFIQVYSNFVTTMSFICAHYEDILDDDSNLNKSRTFSIAIKAKKVGFLRLRDIIELAQTTEYSRKNKDKQIVILEEEEKVNSKRMVTSTTYVSAASVSPTTIRDNIRNIIRTEESTSLYRIMKIVRNYNKEITM
jgi:hypothetical protein